MAYSPLAMGILSGKYLSPGNGPPDARLNLFKGLFIYCSHIYFALIYDFNVRYVFMYLAHVNFWK